MWPFLDGLSERACKVGMPDSLALPELLRWEQLFVVCAHVQWVAPLAQQRRLYCFCALNADEDRITPQRCFSPFFYMMCKCKKK